MAGITRTRTRQIRSHGAVYAGSFWNGYQTVTNTAAVGLEKCIDVLGNPMGDNPLTLTRTENEPIILDGTNGGTGNNNVTFTRCPATYFSVIAGHLNQTVPYRDATEAIAATHPGQPLVSMPNMLFELKDVPGMLQHAAGRARLLHKAYLKKFGKNPTHRRIRLHYGVKSAGEDYLNYVFGWAPFFGDLSSILSIDEYLLHRRRKYNAIRGGFLKTTGKLGSWEAAADTALTVQSNGTSVKARQVSRTKGERWFSAKWRADPIRYGEVLHGPLRQQLRDYLGFDNELPLQIWNALPWTWLSDWFLNVGAIISLMGNRQGIQYHSSTVMTHTVTEHLYNPIGHRYLTATQGVQRLSKKERIVYTPTFIPQDAFDNIFEPSHLATLAALKVTRASGSSRF